jgi:hypothetical protein
MINTLTIRSKPAQPHRNRARNTGTGTLFNKKEVKVVAKTEAIEVGAKRIICGGYKKIEIV